MSTPEYYTSRTTYNVKNVNNTEIVDISVPRPERVARFLVPLHADVTNLFARFLENDRGKEELIGTETKLCLLAVYHWVREAINVA